MCSVMRLGFAWHLHLSHSGEARGIVFCCLSTDARLPVLPITVWQFEVSLSLTVVEI